MAKVLPTPKKFSIQQVFELLLQRPVDNSISAYLTDCKTSGLENTMEMTYPTGARGNVYIGGGFAHSRRATLNVTLATWNTDVLASQNGTEVVTGSTEVTHYDVMKAEKDGKFKTRFTALGAHGKEVGFVYIVENSGSYGRMYTQAPVASTGTFSYSTSTREITFAANDAPLATDYIACSYKFKTADNAQKIQIDSDGIPPVVKVTAYGLAKDICSGELFPAVIEGQAQIDGNWNFDLSADGEAAVQNISMEFVKGCISKELYTITIFTEDEEETDIVETPTATPAGGTYTTEQTVTLTSNTVGAEIYYTVDGSEPSKQSTKYATTITIPATATTVLKAKAYKDDFADSLVMTESYVIS